MKNNNPIQTIERPCYFCTHNINKIDYKHTQIFQRFLSNYSKILPRTRTGNCAKHQRKITTAIKRARFMALIPFTNR